MSFWNLSDGNEVEEVESFDAKHVSVIPDNTMVVACIDSAEWKTTDRDGSFINVTWSVVEGDYQGFKVFQKIRVNEKDEKKRDKALRMLSAIDTNAGGGLRKLGQEPEDLDLAMNLVNKVMGIKVMVWEMDGSSGNWVSMVQSTESARDSQIEKERIDLDEDIDF